MLRISPDHGTDTDYITATRCWVITTSLFFCLLFFIYLAEACGVRDVKETKRLWNGELNILQTFKQIQNGTSYQNTPLFMMVLKV